MDVVDKKLPLVDTFRTSSVGISLVLARSRGVPYRIQETDVALSTFSFIQTLLTSCY